MEWCVLTGAGLRSVLPASPSTGAELSKSADASHKENGELKYRVLRLQVF